MHKIIFDQYNYCLEDYMESMDGYNAGVDKTPVEIPGIELDKAYGPEIQ